MQYPHPSHSRAQVAVGVIAVMAMAGFAGFSISVLLRDDAAAREAFCETLAGIDAGSGTESWSPSGEPGTVAAEQSDYRLALAESSKDEAANERAEYRKRNCG